MAMMNYMPMRGLTSFGGSREMAEQLENLLRAINEA